MQLLISLILALLPAILFIILMRWWDRREPEPARLMLRLFLIGVAAGAILFGILAITETVIVSSLLLPDPDLLPDHSLRVSMAWAVLIAMIAEGIKVGIGYWAARHLRAFTQIVDGIVYLTAIGWGAVLVENVLLIGGDLESPPVFQFVFGTLAAGVSSGLAGFALGKFVITKKGTAILAAGFAAAVTLHAAFRFFIHIGEERTAGMIAIIGALYLFSRFFVRQYIVRHPHENAK